MGRRRHDWIQFAVLLLALVSAALHLESRISKVEEHLVSQDRDNERLHNQLDRMEDELKRRHAR